MRVNRKNWLTDPDNLLRVEGWARDGLTDEQIAKNIGISIRTLYDWKKSSPQFLQSLKRGKEVIDLEVENALHKRAMGYEYEEKTYENGKLVKVVKKQQPPDVTAQIFWLKNRNPEKWRDTKNIDVKGELTVSAMDKLKAAREKANGKT